MKKVLFILGLIAYSSAILAQPQITPELLWQVKRLGVLGMDKSESTLYYKLTTPNVETNDFDAKYYKIPIEGGDAIEIKKDDVLTKDKNISPDGNYTLYHKEVQIEAIEGKDVYNDLTKSDVYIFSDLHIRHWDTWQDGSYNHVFYKNTGANDDTGIYLMPNQPYHTPQRPFGGDEDYIWSPDSKAIYYVSKKLKGKAYATSTNTDIYKYNLQTQTTENLTAFNKGYDTNP